MRRSTIALSTVCLLLVASSASALEPPRLIPRSQRIDRPIEQVFTTLKTYFSDPALSMFNLKSAERVSGTIVATRHGIDGGTWSRWAACTTSPEQMLDQLEDGAVTVTIKLEPSGNRATFISATADFRGTYGLGSSSTIIECVSKGGLEQSLIAVATGAQSQATP
ncbi:MAG TPA: hypothetical protein VEJ86_09485 [Candidatus Binataceae bacterium]|nr:hypothetical protein [Candidatus Binataceae bacterium]